MQDAIEFILVFVLGFIVCYGVLACGRFAGAF